MFGFHITSSSAVSVSEAIIYGFLSWAFLVASISAIYATVRILNHFLGKKK